MALTWTAQANISPASKSYRTTQPGNTVEWSGALQFDSSYPTGGELYDLADIDSEVDTLSGVFEHLDGSSNGTYLLVLDTANTKILVYTEAGVEVANATDLSGATGLFAIKNALFTITPV